MLTDLSANIRVNPASFGVTSEIGYPSNGLSPDLDLKFPGICGDIPSGVTGSADCQFTITETAFVGLERSVR